MKLLIVMITYNRLAYTEKTLRMLLNTIKVPHYIVVVDNYSTDGTRGFLKEMRDQKKIDYLILSETNYFPGKATNIGWEMGIYKYPEATHLMRLDNDFVLLPDWDITAEKYFEKVPNLGQLGLDHSAIEGHEDEEQTINGINLNPWPGNVGGTNIIKRQVWDMQMRYDESRWSSLGKNIPTPQEDCRFSHLIIANGFLMGHMTERLAWTFADESNWNDYPEYYEKTFTQRGYDHLIERIKK